MRFDAQGSDGESQEGLRGHLQDLLSAMSQRPGFRAGSVGRSPDDPVQWAVTSFWEDMGSLRRGLSGFDVKMALGVLTPFGVDQTSVFESVLSTPSATPPATPSQFDPTSVQPWSDRSDDADRTGPSGTLGGP